MLSGKPVDKKVSLRVVEDLLDDPGETENDDFDDLESYNADETDLTGRYLVYVLGRLCIVDLDEASLSPISQPNAVKHFSNPYVLIDYVETLTGKDFEKLISHEYGPEEEMPTQVGPSGRSFEWTPKEPKKYTLDQKLVHEVFRHGNFVVLRIPEDPDWIQREGYSMRHCLSVAHKSYCERMKKKEIALYSLTDLRDGEPRVDIEVAMLQSSYGGPVTKPTVTQIRGIANQCPPNDEYIEPLIAFFKTQNWAVSGHGVKNFDGKVDGDLVVKRWQEIAK